MISGIRSRRFSIHLWRISMNSRPVCARSCLPVAIREKVPTMRPPMIVPIIAKRAGCHRHAVAVAEEAISGVAIIFTGPGAFNACHQKSESTSRNICSSREHRNPSLTPCCGSHDAALSALLSKAPGFQPETGGSNILIFAKALRPNLLGAG